MDVEASDKPKFSVGDDGNFNFILLTPWSNNTSHSDVRNPVSYDDDDVSSSQRLSQMANLETCNRAVLTKKRKKPSDNSNSLHNSVKKSKVSTYDDIADKQELLPSEQTDILVTLQESSNPAKLVLDKMKDDNGLIIDDRRINLLEKLMGISPNIELCVKKEALKLAITWKANMKENTENSLLVLGFLMLLSIYRLLNFFKKDEVLELFANEVSDYVKNLISKKQFIVAVRFSSAYNLADNNQLVDLLRKHVQNARLVFESSCKPTDSVEIKDKARNQEIASLETVQQCIADYNLESEDLLREIEYRILVQKAALDSQVI